MNFGEMKADVKVLSGEQSLTKCGTALNHIYRSVINKLKWPQLLVNGSAIPLVAGTQGYSLPSDFRWPGKFWVVDSSGQRIYLRSRKDLNNTTQRGTSLYYSLKKATVGTATTRGVFKVYLEEIPNDAFVSEYTSLYHDYYFQPSDMSGDTDVPQLDAGDDQLLVYGAVVLLTAKQGDRGGYDMIGRMWTDGLADMVQKAIDFYGKGIVVGPGDEITETEYSSISDYGRKL